MANSICAQPIKQKEYTDTTSTSGMIGIDIEFSRIISVKVKKGYNYYGLIRESLQGYGAIFFIQATNVDVYPANETEINFVVTYI